MMITGPEHITLMRSCPLCGAGTGFALGDICFEVFDEAPVVGKFTIVTCDNCGFAFNDTPSRQTDFNRYYEENAYYFTSGTISSGGSSAYETKRLEALASRISPYIPKPDAAIFDIGCSKGGLLAILNKRGFSRLFGVDMNPSCVMHIKEALGFSAEMGSALEIPFSDTRADVLIYSHVVEHVIDLKCLLAAAREKLNDGGIVCVEVPDASRYGECSFLPYQDLYLEHVNHFDPEMLVNLFHEGGFTTICAEQVLAEASPRGNVPCVWAVFRKGVAPQRTNSRNIELKLRNYLGWSAQHDILEKFKTLELERSPLYIWGISQYAMLLLGQTALRKCNLAGLVDMDSYKQTRTLQGMPIQHPDILRHKVNQDYTVLVTALGYEEQVIRSLKEMNFKGTIMTLSGEPRR